MMTAFYRLTVRNWKVFAKDRANLFFALLAPLIVLGLYVLFLGRVQVDGILASLEKMGAATAEAKNAVQAFCDSWMLVGVTASAAITVPLCACGVIIQDKNRGIAADLLASPIPRRLPAASYFCAVVLAGLIVGGAVLVICFVWLACAGSWFLTAADVLGSIGTLVLSVLSSSTLLVFVVGFFRSQGAFTGLNVILGTVVGFLIGAYMPVSYFPTAVQYCTLFIPGTYSAGLLRNLMMRGALENIAQTVAAPFGQPFAEALAEEFTFSFDFFGIAVIEPPMMAVILAGCTVLFGALCLATAALRRKKG